MTLSLIIRFVLSVVCICIFFWQMKIIRKEREKNGELNKENQRLQIDCERHLYFATLPDGTELYEGDKVLIRDSVTATVEFSGGGFHIYGLEDANGRRPDYTLSNSMKVIGNIYDDGD